MSEPRLMRVILESPYAGNIERNTVYARRALADSLSRNEAPIASHLLYTQPGVLDENNKEERAKGIKAGMAWIFHGERMVVYADYGTSIGIEAAVKEAKRIGLPVEIRRIGLNG